MCARFSRKYDITKHPRYKYPSDADKKNTFDVERYIRVQRKKKKHPSAVIAPEEPFDLYEIELSDEDAGFYRRRITRQKELFMELSNYQAFMECMRKWEKIGCNILCGLALWERDAGL
ncbi:MAG: hypothetical protein ACLUGP_06830 [Faecalibacterium prausnitzii]